MRYTNHTVSFDLVKDQKLKKIVKSRLITLKRQKEAK